MLAAVVAGLIGLMGCSAVQGVAQTGAGAGSATTPATPPAAQPPAQASSADPFPPVNPRYFTAQTPTAATVDAFLRALWGYDTNRIWRVAAIQTTPAAGVSKVTVFVTDRSPNAKVQSTAFFVLPDGKHAIAGDSGVVSFGATPFADARAELQEHADGPSRGSEGKQLMLVEFADMQCPHCKDAQGTMDQLLRDFPKARVVYQNFPLTEIHPFAFKAAADGLCVAKSKPSAFWIYLQSVYDTQEGLTPEAGDQTLANAITKAGLDPRAVETCAATPAICDQVTASVKLGDRVGVDQTPLLAVNGHLLPLTAIPYETLKNMITFQAHLDGVQ